ncbi:MAG: glycosyltransferase family 4 protein [Candidatus Aenigmarchaeota archaeon]|nr:glycosyltransferase family 4 protein [Candidatus Aenigmarchaeota archaeon]
MSDNFLFYIDERNKRSLNQILEMDQDALRYSIIKYCKEKSIKPLFFYFHNFDKNIEKSRIIIKKRNFINFINFINLISRSKVLYINIQGVKEFFIALITKVFYPKTKIVHHFHGIFKIENHNFFKKLYYKIYTKLFDLLIADTTFEARKINIFVGKNKTHRFFYGSNLRPVKPLKHTKFTLVFVGRISPEKQIEKIIYGLKPIKNSVKLIIIGNIENKNYYNYLIKKLDFMDYEFKGFMNKKDIQKIFQFSDAFINLSSDESFGRVFVEALASGLPVIGSYYAPGPKELIENGVNGFILKQPEELKYIISADFNKIRNYCIKNSKKYSYKKSYETFNQIFQRLF